MDAAAATNKTDGEPGTAKAAHKAINDDQRALTATRGAQLSRMRERPRAEPEVALMIWIAPDDENRVRGVLQVHAA